MRVTPYGAPTKRHGNIPCFFVRQRGNTKEKLSCFNLRTTEIVKHSIRYFNNKPIRAVWDNENFSWWYSAVIFCPKKIFSA